MAVVHKGTYKLSASEGRPAVTYTSHVYRWAGRVEVDVVKQERGYPQVDVYNGQLPGLRERLQHETRLSKRQVSAAMKALLGAWASTTRPNPATWGSKPAPGGGWLGWVCTGAVTSYYGPRDQEHVGYATQAEALAEARRRYRNLSRRKRKQPPVSSRHDSPMGMRRNPGDVRPSTLRRLHGERMYRDASWSLDKGSSPEVFRKLQERGFAMVSGPYARATWKGLAATEGKHRFIATPVEGYGTLLYDTSTGGFLSKHDVWLFGGREGPRPPFEAGFRTYDLWQDAQHAADHLNRRHAKGSRNRQ
jgi:hypothetical protein